MAVKWNPSQHPRDSRGKFIRKSGTSASSPVAGASVRTKGRLPGVGSTTFTAGLRSASVTHGRSFPLPLGLQLHVEAAARIEKPKNRRNYLERLTDTVLLQLAGSIPNARVANLARNIVIKRAVSGPGNSAIILPRRRRARRSTVTATTNPRRVARVSGVKVPRKPRAPRAGQLTAGTKVKR